MKKIVKFRQERAEGPRGFSRWVQPEMTKYLMQCCDCGLVHQLQFRIVSGIKRDIVQFRARRAERYTAQQRKISKVKS